MTNWKERQFALEQVDKANKKLAKELQQYKDIVKKYNIESLNDLDNRLKALDIIINHSYSGGWSGDYTTRYWDMKINEIKVIEKVFKNVPIHALSDK